MATIDLGKVAFVWKGTYASGTTYESKDVVQYTDSGETSSYVYVNASSASGQTPSTSGTVNTTYWNKMAGGTSLTVGNNKIITTDASGNVSSLALGTAGQALTVNSGANGFEFTTPSSGGLKQVKTFRKSSGWSSGANSSDRVEAAPFDGEASITPSATSSIIMAYVHIVVKHGVTWRSGIGRLQFSTDGGSNYADFGMMTSSAYNEGTNMSGNDYAGMFVIPNQNTTNAHKVRFYNMPHNDGHNHRMGSSADTDTNDGDNRSTFGTGATLTLFEYDGSICTLATTA